MCVFKKHRFKINSKKALSVILALSLVLLNALIDVKTQNQQTYAVEVIEDTEKDPGGGTTTPSDPEVPPKETGGEEVPTDSGSSTNGDVEFIEANFEDSIFRGYLTEKFDWIEGNTLTESHLSAVTGIDVSYREIANLKGIEHFKNLQTLNCNNNNLTSLDLSGNPELTTLNCSNNSNLTSLDLSANTALTTLDCFDNPNLTSLDLKSNKNLISLHCYNCNLTSLDLSANEKLEILQCNYNKNLETLNISNNPSLKELYCVENKLTNLDVNGKKFLEVLKCSVNNLVNLNVSGSPVLTTLDCSDNPNLTNLDLSANTALTTLQCNKCSLTTLDLSSCTELEYLECYDQTSTAFLSVSEDGNYIVDMKNVVGEANIENIDRPLSNEWIYDKNTGIMTYVGLIANRSTSGSSTAPSSLSYVYNTKAINQQFSEMAVTLNLISIAFNDRGNIFYGEINSNGKASEPADSTRPGYKFDGWYTSSEGGTNLDNKFDFNTEVTGNIKLYAKWVNWQEFPETSVIVAASEDDSEDSFNSISKGYKLNVASKNDSSGNDEGLISQLIKAVGNKIYGSKIIDVYFTDDDGNLVESTTFSGNVQIYIKIPDGWNYDSMKAFYVTPDSAEEVSMSKEIINGVPYACITTNHFSNYAIVNTESALIGNNPGSSSENIPGSLSENVPNPSNENIFGYSVQKTGDNTLMIVYVLIGVLLSAGIVIILLKSKNKQDKK